MTDILIAGSGFAGMWAALAAARALAQHAEGKKLEITVVSPTPQLVIRPRLYEASIEKMAPDLTTLFAATGVRHLAGHVTRLDTAARQIEVTRPDGTSTMVPYRKFVLATGSHLSRPAIPGLESHAFDVDQLESAKRLEQHLKSLVDLPSSPARNTVVVAGGGFTGIEAAAEMPERLRAILGPDAAVRVILLEQAEAVGPELGPGPRPVIEEALAACGVEVRTGTAVAAIDARGVTTASGDRLEAQTVVWTGGARAHPLAAEIPGRHDDLGRVHADPYLRAEGVPHVFVTGDIARARADDQGNLALMSCQHALILGRVAGHNAAAELLGLPLHPYSQPNYVTCLDLGPWGAVFTEGWDRQVKMAGATAKALKREINQVWIYPPAADPAEIFALAAPDFVITR